MSSAEMLDGTQPVELDSPFHPDTTYVEAPLIYDEDDPELHWYHTVYQGDDMPQLTVRAVVMGSVLGAVMCLSNLYVGLKTGWGLGVSITACILSFAIYKTLRTAFPRWFGSDMSLLENNCMQSTATSAGSSTGTVMVSAISAYLMITGHHIPWHILGWWTFFLAALGVFLAIPMKRQMINREQLKFPTGTASAETLRSLHSEGQEAMDKARSLGLAGLFGVVLTWFRDAKYVPAFLRVPSSIPFPGTLLGYPLASFTISWDMSAIMIAAGAIMGWKIAWSLLLGAVINYGVLAPYAIKVGGIDLSHGGLGYRAIVSWSTWAGASMLVTSGLLMFFMQWKSVVRAFSELSNIFGKKVTNAVDPLARIEVPSSWFASGVIISGGALVWLMCTDFGTRWWMGIVAVAMTFFLSLVACRATGESDITPIGAMGKITQLMFGTLAPSNMITNLMTASVTAGAATASADLLTDLKSGYLLGANPRKQFIAQFLGIFIGTIVVVPAFYLMVPGPQVLGTDKWPAPAAQVWAKVAQLLAHGFGALHWSARYGLFIGGLVGIIIPLLEVALPRYRRFIPSATGIGLAMVIPFFNSLSMFVGAGIALLLEKYKPALADKYVIPVSSGVIAGESLMGCVVSLLWPGG